MVCGHLSVIKLEWLPYIFHSLQVFLGDLARSLGKDPPLSDVLQMLDEHYRVVMMFHALSKELFSLKQGLGENVAEFGVCLSQQVQILQSECLGRIQLEHVEEMKHDHFHEALSPEYWQLAHKGDGEPPASYSNLLLVAQKVERWAEAQDSLPLQTATTSGLNVMCSQTQGICFPHLSWKATTFAGQATTVGNDELKRSSCKPQWKRGDRVISWQGDWSLKQSRRDKSVHWVYHSFH